MSPCGNTRSFCLGTSNWRWPCPCLFRRTCRGTGNLSMIHHFPIYNIWVPKVSSCDRLYYASICGCIGRAESWSFGVTWADLFGVGRAVCASNGNAPSVLCTRHLTHAYTRNLTRLQLYLVVGPDAAAFRPRGHPAPLDLDGLLVHSVNERELHVDVNSPKISTPSR